MVLESKDKKKRIEELTHKLKKKSLELKVKMELGHHLDRDPDSIKGNERITFLVKHMWHAKSNDRKGIEDRFDGLYRESEYYVQFLIRQVGYILNLKFDLDNQSRTITVEKLIEAAWKLLGH